MTFLAFALSCPARVRAGNEPVMQALARINVSVSNRHGDRPARVPEPPKIGG